MDHHFSYWFRFERLGGGTLIASWYEINNDSLLFFFFVPSMTCEVF